MTTTTLIPKTSKPMLFTSNYEDIRQKSQLGAVRQHLAEAMVGKTVELLSGRSVAHGIVSGVMLLAKISAGRLGSSMPRTKLSAKS